MDFLFSVIIMIVRHGGLVVCFLLKNAPLIGNVALLAICLIITLDRLFYPDEHYDIQIEGTNIVKEGKSTHLKGNVKFHHTMKLLKWQKYQNNKYIDINTHKPKYQGSSNDLINPILFLHDLDVEDEVYYRLQVDTRRLTLYSNELKVKVLPTLAAENPRIKISTEVKENRYYVAENVTITASIENPLSILCVMWQRETLNGDHAVDVTLPKYKGTIATPNKAILQIRDCCETDIGTYFLLAAFSCDTEITSNKLHLNITKGSPAVSLTFEPQAQEEIQEFAEEYGRRNVAKVTYHEHFELKATIRSFPKHSKIEWLKGSEVLDLCESKYKRSSSSCEGDKTVLCIDKVTEEDEDVYAIKVYNDLGIATSESVDLKVTGDFPKVRLEEPAQNQAFTYGGIAVLVAEIHSLPPPIEIQWKKNKKVLEVDGKKFSEDILDDHKAQLTIGDLDFEDSGKYSIAVTNSLGSDEDEVKICVKVQGGDFLFISGPVVVSASKEILFKTIFPHQKYVQQAKWFQIQNNVPNKIKLSANGNTKLTFSGVPPTESLTIPNAMDNYGTYQLCSNDLKSNKITVFPEESGKFSTENEENFLRFFSLLTISKEAMKAKLEIDMRPDNFQDLMEKYGKYCSSKRKTALAKTSLDELDITIMYEIFRNVIKPIPPANGWGNKPNVINNNPADDIERTRKYRNDIAHSDNYEMATEDFNNSALDLIGAIQRLSGHDEKLINRTCDVLSKVFCKGKEIEDMIEKIKDFREKAKEMEHDREEHETDDGQWSEIRFHHVYDESIMMLKRCTIAVVRRFDAPEFGIFFMNLPMVIGKKIFIRGRTPNSLKIGLTNKNPNNIRLSSERDNILDELQAIYFSRDENDACISMNENSSLEIFADDEHQRVDFSAKLSPRLPVWLVFVMREWGVLRISKQRITESTFDLGEKYHHGYYWW